MRFDFSLQKVVFVYLCANLFLGHLVYVYRFGYTNLMNEQANGWTHHSYIFVFYLIQLIAISFLNKFIKIRSAPAKIGRPALDVLKVFLLSAMFFFFLDFPIHLDFLGGSGSFSSIMLMVLVLSLSWEMRQTKYGLLFLAILCGFIAIQSPTNKRDVIFLYLALLYLNFHVRPKTSIIWVASNLGLIFALVMFMSVLRGYTYEDLFGSLARNFELSYFYFHGFNSTEMLLKEQVDLLLGVTYLKAFLVFFPEAIFNYEKPDSIISFYTVNYLGQEGLAHSFPINFFSELFLNFGLAALVMFPIMWLVFLSVNRRICNGILRSRFAYVGYGIFYIKFLNFVRGSGLDQFVVELTIGLIFTTLIHLILLIGASARDA